MSAVIIRGDCVEAMAGMGEASVDAIVCDPPYGLGFMGKEWDDLPPGREWAEQCVRVLKPGGHLLAFGGTRTFHRLACAVEDAGFEIRDTICWLYGSGFPKSRNLDGDWQGWGTALKPAHEPVVVARKPLDGTVAANVLAHGTGGLNVDGCRVASAEGNLNRGGSFGGTFGNGGQVAATSHPSGRWPANVVLDEEAGAMLDEQTYGDSGGASRFFYCAKASRAERNAGLVRCECETFTPSVNAAPSQGTPAGSDTPPPRDTTEPTSEEDSDSSTTGSGSSTTDRSPKASKSTTSTDASRTTESETSNSSTPSRTSGSTRPTTDSEPASGSDVAPSASDGSEPPPSTSTSAAKAGSFTADADPATSESSSDLSSAGGLQCPECGGVRGGHPTVKPVALMRWLVRLVTPPGGIVLDPFAGSGTTGIAALVEGFEFIGIERVAEYADIADARMAHWAKRQLELAAS